MSPERIGHAEHLDAIQYCALGNGDQLDATSGASGTLLELPSTCLGCDWALGRTCCPGERVAKRVAQEMRQQTEKGTPLKLSREVTHTRRWRPCLVSYIYKPYCMLETACRLSANFVVARCMVSAVPAIGPVGSRREAPFRVRALPVMVLSPLSVITPSHRSLQSIHSHWFSPNKSMKNHLHLAAAASQPAGDHQFTDCCGERESPNLPACAALQLVHSLCAQRPPRSIMIPGDMATCRPIVEPPRVG